TASGNLPRSGPTTFSRYAFADAAALILHENRFFTLGIAIGSFVNPTSRTSCKFEAGSVLNKSTLFLGAARLIAVAHAVDVLATPPFPVKNKNGVSAVLFGLNNGYIVTPPIYQT